MDWKKTVLFVIRLVVGCTFVASAVLKLFSIQNFELYVYGFGFFNLTATAFLVRFLIVAEFLLGVGLVFRIFYQYTWWATAAMLLGFSALLIYVSLFRSNENCHCFGDFVELDAVQSLVKNAVLFICLFFIKKQNEWRHSAKAYIVAIAIVAALFGAFFGKPMNSLFLKLYGSDEERFCKEMYDQTIAKPEYAGMIDSTRNQIIGVVSAMCGHCKAGNKIVQAIFEQNGLATSGFSNLIMARNDTIVDTFKIETNTKAFSYKIMPAYDIIQINKGRFPTYIFLEKGVPIKALNYKELKEDEIVSFLKN